MTIARILVPVDYSPQSLAAATFAVGLARQLGARLLLLTVLDVADLRVALKAHLYDFTTDAEVHRAVRRWIREESARFVIPPDVSHTRRIRRGIVDQEILAAIRSYGPQLVVMGSHGLMRSLPIGSTTASVLRRSTVPVLVVTQASVAPQASGSRPRRSESQSRSRTPPRRRT